MSAVFNEVNGVKGGLLLKYLKFLLFVLLGHFLFTMVTQKPFSSERIIDILGISFFTVFFLWLFDKFSKRKSE